MRGTGGAGREKQRAFAYSDQAVICCVDPDVLHGPAEVGPVHGQERLSPPETRSRLLVGADQ